MKFEDIFKTIKRPIADDGGPVVFSVVGNERYLLEYFLPHYRRLGIKNFYFIIDVSEDGTTEFLMEQDDCGLFSSKFKFADKIKHNFFGRTKSLIDRAGIFFKFAFPHFKLQNRWVLTLDVDEFMVLPSKTPSIGMLISSLKQNHLTSCRALLVDMFPKTLAELNPAKKRHPNVVCKYFNPPIYTWPNNLPAPTDYLFNREVRFKIANFYNSNLDNDSKGNFKIEKSFMWKVPIVFWSNDTFGNAHRTSERVNDKIQIILTHYHFHDQIQKKFENAINKKQYYNSSNAYLPLHSILKKNPEFLLVDKFTKTFNRDSIFEDLGMCFIR